MDIWHYPRTELAEQVLNIFNTGLSHSLTFFAPRRKGKTEFLLKDILPLAESKGWNVFYFSFLGESQTVEQRFIRSLEEYAQGETGKIFKHITTVGLAGVKAELKHDDHADILNIINQLAKSSSPCLLLLDEIQALASKNHYPIIASLRTALDINKDNVKVIFTGSNRENLRLMFSSSKAPFFHYGQNLTFPDLGRGFTDHLADLYTKTTTKEIDKESLWGTFVELQRSPQMIRALIERMVLNPSFSIEYSVSHLLAETREKRDYPLLFSELTMLQKILLLEIAKGGTELYNQSHKPIQHS